MEAESEETEDQRRMLPLYEYWQAELAFISKAVRWMMRTKDPVYAQIRTVSYKNRPPASQNTLADGRVLRANTVKFGYPFSFPTADVVGGNLDNFVCGIDAAADAYLPQIMANFFDFVTRTSIAVGTATDAQGQAFSHDLMLDMLRKVEVHFDADGNPKLPSLAVSPQQMDYIRTLPPPTAEQHAEAEAIIEEKRRASLANRRYRALSGYAE